jgi:hypothetical protein
MSMVCGRRMRQKPNQGSRRPLVNSFATREASSNENSKPDAVRFHGHTDISLAWRSLPSTWLSGEVVADPRNAPEGAGSAGLA